MPKSRKFRKDYKIEFELDPMKDVPPTEFTKFLPTPKPMVFYHQKNHGKYREPSIVIFNQKIQGKSKKMRGMTRTFSEKYNKTMRRRVKKTRRNRSNKYKKEMMGGVNTPPRTPPSRHSYIRLPPPQTPQGQQPVGQSNISPNKDKKEDELNNSIQPTNLFL
jgi:hypothetical protein